MATKKFKNVPKKPKYSTEADRYIAAAKLVATKNMTLVEAIKETGVCLPEYVQLAKQVAWPVSDNWSKEFTKQSRVEKLLLLAELSKG